MVESRIVAFSVSEITLGIVLEAARNYAVYLQARAAVPGDAPCPQRAGVEPLLGFRDREMASRESQEIMQAARHVALLVRR